MLCARTFACANAYMCARISGGALAMYNLAFGFKAIFAHAMSATSSFADAVGSHAFRRRRGAPTAPAPSSHLATLLKEHYAWGWMSGPIVQALAQAAVEDGLRQDDIVALGAIGSYGTFAGNTRRDLFRNVLPQVRVPEPLLVEIPFVRKGDAKRE
eukprot:14961263-Alexandrium_andersonii.AAC.1